MTLDWLHYILIMLFIISFISNMFLLDIVEKEKYRIKKKFKKLKLNLEESIGFLKKWIEKNNKTLKTTRNMSNKPYGLIKNLELENIAYESLLKELEDEVFENEKKNY